MPKISPEEWATMSPAQKFANMPQEKQDEILGDTDLADLEYVWDEWWARPNQVIPEDPYYPIHLLLTGRGWGKALATDTPIPTPNGWRTMGQLTPGDLVYDENGSPTKVTQVHPIYTPADEDMYRLHFYGGYTLDACGDHLWTTIDYQYMLQIRLQSYQYKNIDLHEIDWLKTDLANNRAQTVDTRTMYENQYYTVQGYTGERRANYRIGRAKALQGTYIDPPEPEYTLGALIPTFSPEELPTAMLRSTYSQRWEMLQGLTDAHGKIDHMGSRKRESVKFNLTFSKEQKAFARELITSLGFETVTDYNRPGRRENFLSFYPHTSNPFRHSVQKHMLSVPDHPLLRSMFHTVRKIERITPRPVRCITVESPNALYLAGEGMIPTHNTRTMAEWIRRQAMNNPGCRIGILGRTAADVRDIMATGESGVLNVGPKEEQPEFKPSQRRLEWPNGSIATLFSAETPDQLRGQQFHYFACDELAAYTQFVGVDGLTAFENMRIATRLGERPYGVVATTPKRTEVIRDLLEDAKEGKVRVVRGSTKENASLSSAYKDVIFGQFAGTALEKQELEGLMLDDFPEGALWTEEIINPYRYLGQTPPVTSGGVVIAVDPSVSENPKDECGIVAIGFTNHRQLHQRHAYVLEDGSILAKPEVWAERVAELYNRWGANAVVVETNQGRSLLTSLMHSINPRMRIIGVNASQGKRLRAEPVVMPYQQGRVHHYGTLATLESQLTTWEPEHSKNSPDRLDALVHGITATLIKPPPGMPVRSAKSISPAGRRMNLSQGAGRYRQSPRQIQMNRSR